MLFGNNDRKPLAGIMILCAALTILSPMCLCAGPNDVTDKEILETLEEALSQFSEKNFLEATPDGSSGRAKNIDLAKRSLTCNVIFRINETYRFWEEKTSAAFSNICSSCELKKNSFSVVKRGDKVAVGAVEYTFANASVVEKAMGKLPPDEFYIRFVVRDKDGFVIVENISPLSSVCGSTLTRFCSGDPTKYSYKFDNLTEKQIKAADDPGAKFEFDIDTEKELREQSIMDVGLYINEHPDLQIAFEDGTVLEMVNLSPYFCIGKYEVKQGLWKLVMEKNPSWGVRDDNRPVENISWDLCCDMISKLNDFDEAKQYNLYFRLPTRAEWRFACLAGGTGQFGDIEPGKEGSLTKMGWYSSNVKEGRPPNKPQKVGTKDANAFEIYDMHGNVAEWVADGTLPTFRYACGGSYKSPKDKCTAESIEPVSRVDGQVGFRLYAEFK